MLLGQKYTAMYAKYWFIKKKFKGIYLCLFLTYLLPITFFIDKNIILRVNCLDELKKFV